MTTEHLLQRLEDELNTFMRRHSQLQRENSNLRLSCLELDERYDKFVAIQQATIKSLAATLAELKSLEENL